MATKKPNLKNPRLAKALGAMTKSELMELAECSVWSSLWLERGKGREPSTLEVSGALAQVSAACDARRGAKGPTKGSLLLCELATAEFAVAANGGQWLPEDEEVAA